MLRLTQPFPKKNVNFQDFQLQQQYIEGKLLEQKYPVQGPSASSPFNCRQLGAVLPVSRTSFFVPLLNCSFRCNMYLLQLDISRHYVVQFSSTYSKCILGIAIQSFFSTRVMVPWDIVVFPFYILKLIDKVLNQKTQIRNTMIP